MISTTTTTNHPLIEVYSLSLLIVLFFTCELSTTPIGWGGWGGVEKECWISSWTMVDEGVKGDIYRERERTHLTLNYEPKLFQPHPYFIVISIPPPPYHPHPPLYPLCRSGLDVCPPITLILILYPIAHFISISTITLPSYNLWYISPPLHKIKPTFHLFVSFVVQITPKSHTHTHLFSFFLSIPLSIYIYIYISWIL